MRIKILAALYFWILEFHDVTCKPRMAQTCIFFKGIHYFLLDEKRREHKFYKDRGIPYPDPKGIIQAFNMYIATTGF